MTKKRAERLTGYTIRELPGVRGRVRFAAFDGAEFIAEATGEIEWLALQSLVHIVLNMHAAKHSIKRAGSVLAASDGVGYKSITASIGRMVARIGSRISNPCAGIAIA